jgi:putative transposase
MARLARIVAAGVPHHVTQRGNRREPIFFEAGDQDLYRHMLADQARRHGVEVWAYCLMPNHVHLIMVPQDVEGLGRVMGEAHRRYTSFVNARARWSGHLFQGRYASVAMDEAHLIAAVRYVSLNPVRAGLARAAEDWPWSSARAHLKGQDDGLVRVRPVLDRVSRFSDLIGSGAEIERRYDDAVKALRSSQTTGRPLGTADFVDDLERRLGRPLARRTRGRKPQGDGADHPNLL